jgi:type IV pilus assembly protein PilB
MPGITGGAGCQQCFDTGCRGRIGIYEFLRATPEIRNLVTTGATLSEIQKQHKAQGGTTLLEDGMKRAEDGMTSVEEVMRVAFFD